MTVKTTLNAKDVDNAYLRIKDVVKEHLYNSISIFLKNMTVMCI